jgi:predicted nucleic acid-binding protein
MQASINQLPSFPDARAAAPILTHAINSYADLLKQEDFATALIITNHFRIVQCHQHVGTC